MSQPFEMIGNSKFSEIYCIDKYDILIEIILIKYTLIFIIS